MYLMDNHNFFIPLDSSDSSFSLSFNENVVSFTCLSNNSIDLSSNYKTFFVLCGRAIIDKITVFNNIFIPSSNNVTEASNNIVDSLFRTYRDDTTSVSAYIDNNILSLSTNKIYKNSTNSTNSNFYLQTTPPYTGLLNINDIVNVSNYLNNNLDETKLENINFERRIKLLANINKTNTFDISSIHEFG